MPNHLREAILAHMSGRREIFGSDLGYLIKRLAPDWDLKSEYRSLRAFVEQELSDVLENVGKQGGNDIYRNKAYSGGATALSGDDRALWSLFSNPQRKGSIFVRGGELIAQDEGASAPEGAYELPRIKSSEYAQLLRTCVNDIPSDVQERFNAILSANETSPWSEVLNLLRKTENGPTSRLLEQKRVEYVSDRFKTHLRNLGCEEAQVGAFAERLAESRGRRESTKAPVETVAAPVSHIGLVSAGGDLDTIVRSAAKKAIDQMSLEQIRALNLPMGLVVDAMLSRH
ncbi:hypothetical protein [Burkholderia territorii]|uniref:hypothetical protein n=1 Tax=Burkholderia territorii TaxID=1503055 RepID=UPI000B144AF1|nr:hypothetical protein [Burkholderia territorii]